MTPTSKFPIALHLLVYFAENARTRMATEDLIDLMPDSSAVVRKTLAALRKDGILKLASGENGGWFLGRKPREISLHDIYTALGEQLLIASVDSDESIIATEFPALAETLGDLFRDAESLLATRFSRISLHDFMGQLAIQERHL